MIFGSVKQSDTQQELSYLKHSNEILRKNINQNTITIVALNARIDLLEKQWESTNKIFQDFLTTSALR